MAKAKRTRRTTRGGAKKINWGGPSGKGAKRINITLAAFAAGALVTAGVLWWRDSRIEGRFLALAAEGQAALDGVQTFRNDGRTHLQPGESHRYSSSFPTSGAHSLKWTDPGVYDEPQRPTQLVHSLEHGHIVIYYDDPGADVLDTLKDWASLYDGQWDGVVVTPAAGLGRSVVVTAWRKAIKQDRFDPAGAAAFVDAFRGRGPEHPVR